jgi:hypothetical protein
VFAAAPAAHAATNTTAPTNLQVTFPDWSFSASFTWGPATGYSGPFWYEVYLNGDLVDDTPSTQMSSWVRDLYSLSPYTVSVVANDRFGNRSAPATNQFTIPRPAGPVPTTPQNLRGNYVDGVLQSFTWDASTMEGLEHSIWYEIHLREGNGARNRAMVFHTTVTPQELVDSLYLDPGGTYTIRIVAWGHTAGANRPSDYSNSLTVTFPNT